jgi:hypothetical protein
MRVRTEVSDLEAGTVVRRDGVDWEMGVDEAHLVEEALHGLALEHRTGYVVRGGGGHLPW